MKFTMKFVVWVFNFFNLKVKLSCYSEIVYLKAKCSVSSSDCNKLCKCNWKQNMI